MIARSAVEAPVAMLRVYCSCPGVSAIINLRARRGKIAISDVNRDSLLTFRAQTIRQKRKIYGPAERLIGLFFTEASWSSGTASVVKQATDQR